MLRVYFLQQWFNLGDPGAEDVLYESGVLRRFAGVDLGRGEVGQHLNFRHLLEAHQMGAWPRTTTGCAPVSRWGISTCTANG